MMQRILVPTMLLLGLVLLILGSQWNRVRPVSAYWTEEQADEYSKAQVELHSLSHEHSTSDPHAPSPAFNAAKERFAKISGDLAHAQKVQNRTGTIFVAAGLISISSAIVLHYRRK
jgi:hypothetical protein